MDLEQRILAATKATEVTEKTTIQNLWSGYGEIVRVALKNGTCDAVIVKKIQPPKKSVHPRGWNTDASFQRKVKSYEIEKHWYETYSSRVSPQTKIPNVLFTFGADDAAFIVMEDLNALGYSKRLSSGNFDSAKLCIQWLARFHATFMNTSPEGLWKTGTYWHLDTRQDELVAMKNGKLKDFASEIDTLLNSCQYKTIVHGDAKLANFCFYEDESKVATVDFQYVGGGCGMKDVAYFLGSCLSEKELESREETLLGIYFDDLCLVLKEKNSEIDCSNLEREWRDLYDFAWADFSRFLMGWMPGHQKLNGFSECKIKKVIERLNK